MQKKMDSADRIADALYALARTAWDESPADAHSRGILTIADSIQNVANALERIADALEK